MHSKIIKPSFKILALIFIFYCVSGLSYMERILWLMPDFSNFLSANFESQVSSIFVYILLLITIVSVCFVLKKYFNSLSRLKWLNKLLADVNSDNSVDKRFELIQAADNKKNEKGQNDVMGHLWLEFDETLIETRVDGKTKLYNTIDADYFFSSSNIAKGVTENRLVAAVPGFLTAVGVIGTFVGLQFGLSEMNISANVSVDEMKEGVAAVISGAKVAFMTSVWGVFLSVLFNAFEKFLEQSVRNKITTLQTKIDSIFPRLSPEEKLNEIANYTYESKEGIQGLAEQIGIKMQESMSTATQGISEALEGTLNKIMAPAIDKLVNETSEGNQKALEDLLMKFMDGFGEQGAKQRDAMEIASGKVNDSIDNLGQVMSDIAVRMEDSQRSSLEREQTLIENIASQVDKLSSESSKNTNILSEMFETKISNISTVLEQNANASQSREQEFISNIGQQVNQITQGAASQNNQLTEIFADKINQINESFIENTLQSTEREQHLVDSIKKQVEELTKGVAGQSQLLSTFVENQISSLTSSMDKREVAASERAQEQQKQIENQTKAISESSQELLLRVNESITNYETSAKQIITQGEQLQAGITSSVHASTEASGLMKASSTEMKESARELKLMGSHIREAGNGLSGAISQAVQSTADLAEQNQITAEKIEDMRDDLFEQSETIHIKLVELLKNLNQMFDNSNNCFEQLNTSQNKFVEDLQTQLQKLANQIATLIQDYASQANTQTSEHLRIWAESSSSYAETMNNAARALSSVVDEIQDKVAN